MTDRYVYMSSLQDGSDSTWNSATVAYLTLAAAVAAATSGDNIYVADDHQETLSGTVGYAFPDGRTVCLNRSGDTLSTMDGTTGYIQSPDQIQLNAASSSQAYVYGLYFKTTSTDADPINIALSNDNTELVLESVTADMTSGGAKTMIWGPSDRNWSMQIFMRNCTIKLGGSASQLIVIRSAGVRMVGGAITVTGTQPTKILQINDYTGGAVVFDGVDLSSITGTIIEAANRTPIVHFVNCSLNASLTARATFSTTQGRANAEVFFINCNSGDNHYDFSHHTAAGSTLVDVTVHANDGNEAMYDGTNEFSHVITTTSICSKDHPYEGPWFGRYYDSSLGVTAITPGIEVLRNKAGTPATAYTDEEIWIEVMAQSNSGSSLSNFYTGRMPPQGTNNGGWGAGIGTGSWTGAGTYPTSMKLTTSSFTPQEIGYLKARICVGAASISDLYVDPVFRYA